MRVNCAALADGVLESELFGHEKGAFTGATARRPGRFELADKGTLFLDEVGDMPAQVQVKLLRVLQENEFERVGGVETLSVDVRVVAATHRNLEDMIEKGEFREDLYYRLNVFELNLPPLRDRVGDLPVLAEHFVQKYARRARQPVEGLTAAAVDRLGTYDWPGNVRELENVIERAMILASGPAVDASDLEFGRRKGAPTALSSAAPASGSASSVSGRTEPGFTTGVAGAGTPGSPLQMGSSGALKKQLGQQEKDAIIAAVNDAAGNIAMAARALGINRSTLYYRMRKHQLTHLLPTQD